MILQTFNSLSGFKIDSKVMASLFTLLWLIKTVTGCNSANMKMIPSFLKNDFLKNKQPLLFSLVSNTYLNQMDNHTKGFQNYQ